MPRSSEMSYLEDVRKWSREDAARFTEEHYGAEVPEQFKGSYNHQSVIIGRMYKTMCRIRGTKKV